MCGRLCKSFHDVLREGCRRDQPSCEYNYTMVRKQRPWHVSLVFQRLLKLQRHLTASWFGRILVRVLDMLGTLLRHEKECFILL